MSTVLAAGDLVTGRGCAGPVYEVLDVNGPLVFRVLYGRPRAVPEWEHADRLVLVCRRCRLSPCACPEESTS